MHFWINKGNQQGRYWPRSCRLVRPPPEAVASYLARHQIIRPRGLHPKPMVTPVRRFQSLESVSNNGIRSGRTPSGFRPNNRHSPHNNAFVVYYNSSTNVRIPRVERQRSIDLDTDRTNPQTPENENGLTCIRKFKIALLIFALCSVCVMFGANYLSTGQLWRLGVETLVIITVALVVLLLGGILILFLDDPNGQNINILSNVQPNLQSSNEQVELDEVQHLSEHQRPMELTINEMELREMSPPPYHIAIRLGNQADLEEIQIYNDQSPPPPYEKAVT